MPRPSQYHLLQRAADPVARIVAVLFAAVIVLEVMLATWLPRRLRTERLWGREIAAQELLDQMDWLRSHLRSLKNLDRWQRGEVELSLVCLDEVARYLRDHQDQLSREQLRLLREDLSGFESAYAKWKRRGRFFEPERLAPERWIEQQVQRLNEVAPGGSPP